MFRTVKHMTKTNSTAAKGHHSIRRWTSNQPGAWVLALSPALGGLLVGRGGWMAVWLVALWALCYCVQFTAARWFKSHFRRTYIAPAFIYSAVLAATGIPFVILHPTILWWAPWMAVLVALSWLAAYRREERSLWSSLTVVAASSTMALVVYQYSSATAHSTNISDDLLHTGVPLAVAFLAMQIASVLFVKTMIRERGSLSYFVASVSWCVIIAFAGWCWYWQWGVLGLLLIIKAVIFPMIDRQRRLRPIVAGIAESVGAVVGFVLIVWPLM